VLPKRLDLPYIYTLPEVCVLRDWLIERDRLQEHQIRYFDPCLMIDMAAGDIGDCALEAVCAHLLTLPPTLKFPPGRRSLGRMDPSELTAGFAVHVEALRLARRLGLPMRMIRTRILGRNTLQRARDIAYLVGCIVHVDRGSPPGPPECVLPLKVGWQKAQRKGTTFPWDPAPSGWVIDRKKCCLVHSTQREWWPRAAFDEANQPVTYTPPEHRPGAEVHRVTFVEREP
jgi:hypothetical protein